jgi:hypothetical protein
MLYATSEETKTFHFREIMERCPSWLKERDWKSRVLPKVVPGVRIPLSPPYIPLTSSISQDRKIYVMFYLIVYWEQVVS